MTPEVAVVETKGGYSNFLSLIGWFPVAVGYHWGMLS